MKSAVLREGIYGLNCKLLDFVSHIRDTHKPRRTYKIDGKKIIVYKNVYQPSITSSRFIIKYVKKNAAKVDKALDLGTGCGIIAISLAEKARKIIATDINPVAVKCAMENVKRNRLDSKIEVRLGSLFEPVKNEKFDIITTNIPIFPKRPKNLREYAWCGGEDYIIVKKFMKDVGSHLNPKGKIYFGISSFLPLDVVNKECKKNKLEIEEIAKNHRYFPTTKILKIAHA